ncbi:hypothetical protein C5S36_07830 [Candidatus Methanophagaceae archaeon]|nr:hypothetical protein C5S36_07830 [Methanophagales archaeon]
MDSKRIALLTVAICAIGIFALPGTVSLFSGQHSWYDLSDNAQNDVPCEKCHQDIADEMISDGNGVHLKLTCSMCHRTPFNDYIYGSGYGDGSTPGKEAHAAAVVQCMDCHDHNVSKPGYGKHTYDPAYIEVGCAGPGNPCHESITPCDNLGAGGFGLTGYLDDTGERAAHMDFVNDSIDDPLMEGANEACIACHTRIGVNISWTKSTTLHFNANETHDGTWIIDDFTAHGQNETVSTYKNNWTNSY